MGLSFVAGHRLVMASLSWTALIVLPSQRLDQCITLYQVWVGLYMQQPKLLDGKDLHVHTALPWSCRVLFVIDLSTSFSQTQ